jgi:ABC-2 type transport system permease protein
MQIGARNKQKDILMLAALLVIVVLINFIGSLAFKRFDLTREKRYTIAESTKKLLGELDDVIYLKVYLGGDFKPGFAHLKNETKEILDEFRSCSKSNLEYEFIDIYDSGTKEEQAEKEKQLVKKGLEPEQVTTGTTNEKVSQGLIWPGAIISYKDKELAWQIYNRQIGFNNEEEGINNSIQDLEYGLTNVIRKLRQKKPMEVSFIEGHSEADTVQQYKFMLTLAEYYEVNRIEINGKLSALKDASAIVITKPDSLFSDKDKFIIDQYIMNGGKVLWLVDPVWIDMDTLNLRGYSIGFGQQYNIEDMLFKYGVRLNPVLVQDFQSAGIQLNVAPMGRPKNFKYFPWYYSVLAMPDGSHPIVKNLGLIEMDYVSTIDTITAPGIKKTILLHSTRNTKVQPTPARIAFGMATRQANIQQFNDPYQPLAVLLEGTFNSVVEYRLPDKLLNDPTFKYLDKGIRPTKMIVVADGDLAISGVDYKTGEPLPLGYNKYNGFTYANSTFLLNCMNYLLDDEGLLQLRSRVVNLRLLDKRKIEIQRTKWQMINVVLPAVLIFGFGVLQFYLRRRKYSA